MDNAEINNIIKILGLQYKSKYAEYDEVKKLRYVAIKRFEESLHSALMAHTEQSEIDLPILIGNRS